MKSVFADISQEPFQVKCRDSGVIRAPVGSQSQMKLIQKSQMKLIQKCYERQDALCVLFLLSD